MAKTFIDDSSLPKNFHDATILTRRFGIQYIWIDSICIKQDDTHDWEVESAKMTDIYQNAYVTMAATSSADSSGGCFSKTKKDMCFQLRTGTGKSFLLGARLCDTKGFVKSQAGIEQRFPLYQRAWVFQERLLSRRILNCNYGQFAFHCSRNDTS
jgi:hypothetical protein